MSRSLRIAVADDESDMRDYLEKLLPRLGFQVVAVAENGSDLIELCRSIKPDLVISDLRMPEMDGDDAIRVLTEEATIPFIAMSAFPKPESFGEGLPPGSWVYLHKPVKREALLQAIRTLFPDVEFASGPATQTSPRKTTETGLDAQGPDIRTDESHPPNRSLTLLIVDDDDEFRDDLLRFFTNKGHRAVACADGVSALKASEEMEFDVAIIDLMMPKFSGMDLLQAWKQSQRDCEIIVLTGQGTIELAVEAMKRGASDFLTKPVRLGELEAAVKRIAASAELKKENQQLRVALRQQRPNSPIIGQSRAIQEVFRLIERLAPTDRPVLIQGESGTGKELVARAIHEASLLKNRPLVVINCAALPETLLESELFGHEKGAFTGAFQAKPGLFEIADGGTLFIDEIGELAGSLQAKLLRVLEDGMLRRIGSVKERRTHVRLIAATNRDMVEEVRKGNFREDLYYRISVLTIQIPPLRERIEDLPLLVRHFIGPEWTLADDVLPFLARYTWPGNVRQLANAIERAKILADDETIRLENFPPELLRVSRREDNDPTAPFGTMNAKSMASSASPAFASSDNSQDLEALTRLHVLDAYERCQHNKSRTARVLGINRRSLYRLLDKYGI
jgi:DNA-binding NtrC family response regulator